MDVGVLATQLSSEYPSPATRRAADQFLDLSDPSATLGRMYRFLVRHHTLRTALGHLEEAGADLASLEIPIQAYRETFAGGAPVVWDLDVGPPITAADIVATYSLHRRLLTEPLKQSTDAGATRFVLISGRAYQVRYPHYKNRVAFDSDIVVPDIPAALEILGALEPEGYTLGSLSVQRFGNRPSGKFTLRREERGHVVLLDILLGGYHAHRGPIYERADTLKVGGRTFRTARPEDMLVMLAARIERKEKFALFNFNDAAVILDTDGATLSWDVVCDAAVAAGLQTTLTVLLRRAEGVLGEPRVPSEAWGRLERGLGGKALRKLTERAEGVKLEFGSRRRGGVSDLALRMWNVSIETRQQRRADTPSLASRAIVTMQRRMLLKQIRAITSSSSQRRRYRSLPRARTRSGTFCEVSPHLAASHGCIASQHDWHGSASARALLEDLAVHLTPVEGTHRCGRLQFHLWSAQGI